MRHSTVGAMLGMVREAAVADELSAALLAGAHAVFGLDYATYDEIGSRGAVTLASPESPNAVEAFARLGHQHPAVAYQRATRSVSTYRLSDLATQRQLRRLDLWDEVFAPLAIRYQLCLALHVSGGTLIGLGLSRTRSDFTDDERDLAELLRTELGRLVALREGPAPEVFERLGLSRRQAQVLALSSRRRARDVARVLGISERTVEKHLEHAYRTLGISSRGEAERLARAAQ